MPKAGFEYDAASGEWAAAESSPCAAQTDCRSELRVVAFNVLTDSFYYDQPKSFRPHMLCHDDRHRATLRILKAQDADVIGLNEVSPTFLSVLLAEEWVRAAYRTSIVVQHNKPFGNVLLSRIPFESVECETPLVTRIHRHPHIGVVGINGKRVALVATHLSAYGPNQLRRKKELDHLVAEIVPQDVDVVVVFGDVNYHSERENVNIPPGYVDAWQCINPTADPREGYTFDVVRNLMCSQILPHFSMLNQVQMRLDRVFVLDRASESPAGGGKAMFDFSSSAMRVIGDTPVFSGAPTEPRRKSPFLMNLLALPVSLTLATVSLGGDLIGANLLRDPQKYLFPSDHFGLLAQLKVRGGVGHIRGAAKPQRKSG